MSRLIGIKRELSDISEENSKDAKDQSQLSGYNQENEVS